MAETEHITVATTSAGVGGADDSGRSVDLPVVELLTGRGFVTGKSGSGKSNTASVVAEKLLDNGFGLLVVDIDGEYYGLKEEYEILHVGADEECDIRVTVEHAEKIASLALEENVPIILDISSFLDGDEAEALLTEVAKQLFAKAKKQKQPFLLLVEECHEWIPENGSVGEVGQMLIKIGKRGRKHGLGVVGISQRPADVKKDYITQCDWLVWHRLTWNNDTKVVGRILDSEYADAVEDLDDGEAFLMTDWSESIRRVQFHRKQTFDAGATPGLEDFERPELKSVSEDLVSELTEISEQKRETEDRIQELRAELDAKNSRIAELEAELQDARDMSRMARQFTEALVEHVDGYNPGRTEKEKQRRRRTGWRDEPAESEVTASAGDGSEVAVQSGGAADEAATNGDAADGTSGGGFGDAFGMFDDDGPAVTGGGEGSTASAEAGEESSSVGAGAPAASGDVDAAGANGATNGADGGTAAEASQGITFEPGALAFDEASGDETSGSEASRSEGAGDDAAGDDANSDREGRDRTSDASSRFLRDLEAVVRELDPTTRRMLAFYVEQGPDTALNAHFSAGGSGDRTSAYARNRTLRLAGFVEHVGRGRYDETLRDLVTDEADHDLRTGEVVDAVASLRETISNA